MQEEGAEEIWSSARTVWVREEGGKEWRMLSKAGELDKGWTTRALEVVVARSWGESPFKKATPASMKTRHTGGKSDHS